MTTALHLINPQVTKISFWLSARPALARVAMVALPIVFGVAAALLSHNAAYACDLMSGGGGCGG